METYDSTQDRMDDATRSEANADFNAFERMGEKLAASLPRAPQEFTDAQLTVLQYVHSRSLAKAGDQVDGRVARTLVKLGLLKATRSVDRYRPKSRGHTWYELTAEGTKRCNAMFDLAVESQPCPDCGGFKEEGNPDMATCRTCGGRGEVETDIEIAVRSLRDAHQAARKAVEQWAAKDEGGREVIASAILERLGECATDTDGDDTLEVVSELFEELWNRMSNHLAHTLGHLGKAAHAVGKARSIRRER